MKLPTKKEINVFDTLDEQVACDHFLNKSVAEAEALFHDNSLYYQEDMMWMGLKAFNFYLPAVTNYLKSKDAEGDSDLISFMYKIIEFRSTEEDFDTTLDNVNHLLDYVIKHYNKFDVDEDIYGDLLTEYQVLQKKLNQSAQN